MPSHLVCFHSIFKSHCCCHVLPFELGGVRVRVIDSCCPTLPLTPPPTKTISFPSHGFCFWHMQFYKAKPWCSFMQLLQLQLSFTVSSFTLCSNLFFLLLCPSTLLLHDARQLNNVSLTRVAHSWKGDSGKLIQSGT